VITFFITAPKIRVKIIIVVKKSCLSTNVAASIKIWAIAASLGGTFSSFAVIEKGLFEGEIRTLIRQAFFILISLTGANAGYEFVRLLQRCGGIWGK
jgi:hypothetical protein